jgi:hypothetical protein
MRTFKPRWVHDPLPEHGLPDHFQTRVVGVTFAVGYPDSFIKLGELIEVQREDEAAFYERFGVHKSFETITVVLVKNESNGGVEVHVPAFDWCIGFLPRIIGERMTNPNAWSAVLMDVRSEGEFKRPGVILSIMSITTGVT